MADLQHRSGFAIHYADRCSTVVVVIVLAKRAHIYVLQYPRIIDSVSEDEDPQEEDEVNITALSDDALERLLMSTSVLLDEEVYIPMPKYRKF